MLTPTPKPLLPLLLVALLSACGGGGGGSSSDGGGKTPDDNKPDDKDPIVSTNFSCAAGSGFECSGDRLEIENGIALSQSGVYAYGISTNDLAPSIDNAGSAHGLGLPSDKDFEKAKVEVRLRKAENGEVTAAALFLRNLGLSWDAVKERPPIFETFLKDQQGRIVFDPNSNTVSVTPLPPSSDLDFYDFGKVKNGVPVKWEATQENYANNVYFPRNEPSRPAPGIEDRSIETKGVEYKSRGDWREPGGIVPDLNEAKRWHSDGDLHAGDADPNFPDAVDLRNGRYSLPMAGGNDQNPPPGLGTPYPGFKGYRNFVNRSFQYVNLSAWETQDTVEIVEYTEGTEACRLQQDKCVEHNKMRRGMVAFGNVTTNMPESGSVTYKGRAYGWYANDNPATPSNDVSAFQGDVTITVDYATGRATVALPKAYYWIPDTPELEEASLSATLNRSSKVSNLANYATGTFISAGGLNGAISVRYFGQDAAEMGGTFTMTDASGKTAVAGFIARK